MACDDMVTKHRGLRERNGGDVLGRVLTQRGEQMAKQQRKQWWHVPPLDGALSVQLYSSKGCTRPWPWRLPTVCGPVARGVGAGHGPERRRRLAAGVPPGAGGAGRPGCQAGHWRCPSRPRASGQGGVPGTTWQRFPNHRAVLRPFGACLAAQNDEWSVADHRYRSETAMRTSL